MTLGGDDSGKAAGVLVIRKQWRVDLTIVVMRKIIVSIIAASFTTLACSGADAPESESETGSVQQAMLACEGPPCDCCDYYYRRCLERGEECDGETCYQERLNCERTCKDDW